MKFTPITPPREFTVGRDKEITLKDCGRVQLEPDEQVTFVTHASEFDVARKHWGYYATPSLNGRLRDHNLRSALVVNEQQQIYLMLVEVGKESDFQKYLTELSQILVTWLDKDEQVHGLLAALAQYAHPSNGSN